jgi:cytochrome c peroxidase
MRELDAQFGSYLNHDLDDHETVGYHATNKAIEEFLKTLESSPYSDKYRNRITAYG